MSIKYFFFGLISCLFVASQVSGQAKSPIPYGNYPPAGHYLLTRGFRMYYETYGSGRPLLLLHGNGGSIADMAGQIPRFSRSYQVIAVDSRAQGKSIDPGDSISYSMMADDLNALLDTLHLDSCDVIGWSDGGIDGLLLAIRHPDKVKKLAETGANLTPDTTALVTAAFQDIIKVVKWAKAKPQTPFIRNLIKLQELMLKHPHITPAELHSVHCPTLVIGGDHDLIRPAHTLLIYENIPKAYLWILPDSGHDTLIRYRRLFNQIVGNFFKKPYR
ncbi:MAG TPA: alpha/beta hydrolase [Chitinophagaceae bacterium]|nr:alpha/beta hydrolase [Chitinophagaceae bacterium]